MFRKILTATDMITQCDVSVLKAAQIAKQHNAKLYILHVLESSFSDNRSLVKHFRTGQNIGTTVEYEKEIRNELDKIYATAFKGTLNYEIRVTIGFPWEEIIRWSRGIDTDLIVLGPHTKRAEEKGVIRVVGKVGSTTQGVISRESCPVMIVGPDIKESDIDFKNIVVGVDFSLSCESALVFAAKMAKRYDSIIHVFHMVTIPPYPKYSKQDYEADKQVSETRLKEFCDKFLKGISHEYIIWGGALPNLELLKCADQKNAGFIIMGSHTKVESGKWYAGSAVERTSFRSKCPVIVVTDPDALLAWKGDVLIDPDSGKTVDRLMHAFSKKVSKKE